MRETEQNALTLAQCVTDNRMALNPMYLFPQSTLNSEELKPQLSYIGLIAIAILSNKDAKLVLSDIYQFILINYPYFRNRGPGWRNSVRHNLSLNDCFIKCGRSVNGKGHYWTIHPANLEDFRNGDFRRRRAQQRVRKHMGFSSDCDSIDFDLDMPTPQQQKSAMQQHSSANKVAHHNKPTAVQACGLRLAFCHYTQPRYLFNNLKTAYNMGHFLSACDPKSSIQRHTIVTALSQGDMSNNLKLLNGNNCNCLLQPIENSLKSVLKHQESESNDIGNSIPSLLQTLQKQQEQATNVSKTNAYQLPSTANLMRARKRKFDVASLLAPECSQDGTVTNEQRTLEITLNYTNINSSNSFDMEDNDIDILDDKDEPEPLEDNTTTTTADVVFNSYSQRSSIPLYKSSIIKHSVPFSAYDLTTSFQYINGNMAALAPSALRLPANAGHIHKFSKL